jgi:exopolysaccharide production protein ExoQ
MGRLILIAFLVFAVWLIRRDTARRSGISGALWIPTLWVGILASRPLSAWVGFGGGTDTLEGSPLDRLFFFGFIFAAFIIVWRRQIDWSDVFSRNWPVFLFYAYLLVTVLWAESSVVSFKRWFKDFGNIIVLLVILTEVNPQEAFRAVFVRCAYVLLPLSFIFIRWFPNLGRHYSIHSGAMEATGVTFQKNSLGATVLVTTLVLMWDWMERSRPGMPRLSKVERYVPFAIFAMAAYLINLCDSKTSIACLLLGGGILAAVKLPLLRQKIGQFGGYALAGIAVFYLLDQMFGVSEWIVRSMGRDMTFTGRTDVWRELLALKTDPIFGLGFCSIWSDRSILDRLPIWVGASAHNGYLEMYLDGGYLAVFFLILMLLMVSFKINRQLKHGGSYALIGLVVLLVTIIGDFSESHFGRMSPLWFLFLLVAFDIPPSINSCRVQTADESQWRREEIPARSPVMAGSFHRRAAL